ncbi:MAG: HAD family hydrolase [Erythrobacter sp.]|nr:HAD family hydrolase [Erythrobacter sp.]
MNLFLDLWDTLYVDDPAEDVLRKRLRTDIICAFAADRRIESERAVKIWGEVADWAALRWRNEQRTASASDRFERFVHILRIVPDEHEAAAVVEAVEAVALEHPPKPMGGTEGFLKAFDHLPMIIISDTGQTPGRILRQILKQDGLFDHFDGFVFSDELGAAKPDRRAFDAARSLLPERSRRAPIVHIGDNSDTDISGALAAGLACIHLTKSPCEKHGQAELYSWAPSLTEAARLLQGQLEAT